MTALSFLPWSLLEGRRRNPFSHHRWAVAHKRVALGELDALTGECIELAANQRSPVVPRSAERRHRAITAPAVIISQLELVPKIPVK